MPPPKQNPTVPSLAPDARRPSSARPLRRSATRSAALMPASAAVASGTPAGRRQSGRGDGRQAQKAKPVQRLPPGQEAVRVVKRDFGGEVAAQGHEARYRDGPHIPVSAT